MLLCFSADWHVSNFGADRRGPVSDRGAACLRVVERLYDIQGVDRHVGLGDIFDTDKPTPGLVASLMDRITAPTMLLVGNHDQTSAEDKHNALAPLSSVASVVESMQVFSLGSTDLALLGFRYRDSIVDTLRSVEWSADSKFRVVCLHMGISDNRTPLHLRKSAGSIGARNLAELCQEIGATHVFSGDWHNPEDWEISGVRICQVGGLIPQRYGDPHEVHGRVALFDTETAELSFKTLNGPRFVTVDGDPPWDVPTVPDADPLHVRYLTDRKNWDRALEEAEALGVQCKVATPKTVQEQTTQVDLDVEVPPPDEVALKAAFEKGGQPLADLMSRVLSEVTR
jgi:hypothetical protein